MIFFFGAQGVCGSVGRSALERRALREVQAARARGSSPLHQETA